MTALENTLAAAGAVAFVAAMLVSRWLRARQLERVQLELDERRRRLLGEGERGER